MFLFLKILLILWVVGAYAEVFSEVPQETYPHPIFIPFEQTCTPNNDKALSTAAIQQIPKKHEAWLENPRRSDGARAKFCGADLKGADFTMAMLAGADFRKANLENAKMEYVNLTRADLSNALLTGAKLDNAMLHSAVLRKAILKYASLENAMLFKTNLQGTDLREVKGLTQFQINMACLDKDTKLPPGIVTPKPCP